MVHVYPLYDEIEHLTNGTTCHCDPEMQFADGEMILVHNSYDRREIVEEAERIKWMASSGKDLHIASYCRKTNL